MRDESMHVNFGIDMINSIINENPHIWDEEMQKRASDMIIEGTELEVNYAKDTMPRGVLGMNAKMMEEYEVKESLSSDQLNNLEEMQWQEMPDSLKLFAYDFCIKNGFCFTGTSI